jgi:hypothetical protein
MMCAEIAAPVRHAQPAQLAERRLCEANLGEFDRISTHQQRRALA